MTQRRRVIFFHVDESCESSLRSHFERAGIESQRCPVHSLATLREKPPTLVLIGVQGDGVEACARVRAIRKLYTDVPIVVLAEGLDTSSVVRLMRIPVADVVGLPEPAGKIASRILKLLLDDSSMGNDPNEQMVGQSPIIRGLRSELRLCALSMSNILLTGETGTGKGVAARLIHDHSPRSQGPFVTFDCASLCSSLMESELFGHERGSFTGATGARASRFELAEQGTLFIDEVGELELPAQAKLLRVLQEREYERVGSSRTRRMRARVVVATNRDLRELVTEGRFRADLYFRLSVFHFHLPPLREHLSDLPLLARAALKDLGERLELEPPHLDDALIERMTEYDWPGNVRELHNMCERMVVRRSGESLGVEDLDEVFAMGFNDRCPVETDTGTKLSLNRPASSVPKGSDSSPLPQNGGIIGRDELDSVLRATGGNVARAARRMDVPRSTLRYRIKLHGLQHLIPTD